jgi:hypothetical protein
MLTYNFREGTRAVEFTQALEDTFPFFRMFVDDRYDAHIVIFLATRMADANDVTMLEDALRQATTRITSRYPNALPPGILSSSVYEHELVLIKGISHIIHMVAHLQATAASFAKVIHFGGDPSIL